MADQSWILRDLHIKVYQDMEPRLAAVEKQRSKPRPAIWTEAVSTKAAWAFIALMLLVILPTEKLEILVKLWKASP